MTATPTDRKVKPGSSVSYQVQVVPSSGFNAPVTLSVSGLPSGATENWSVNPVPAPDVPVTLTISTTAETPLGHSDLTITGTSDVLQCQVQVGLTVTNLTETLYLPTILRGKTILFSDDFSNPASGWPVYADSLGIWAYVNGEYQIKGVASGYILWATAGHSVADFDLRVDARQVGTVSTGYGVTFGMNDTASQYYVFVVFPEFQEWYILYWNGGPQFSLVNWGTSPYIKTGANVNQIQVKRSGTLITFYVNNTFVYSNYFSTWSGNRRIGLVMSPYYDQAGAEARFDNYLVMQP